MYVYSRCTSAIVQKEHLQPSFFTQSYKRRAHLIRGSLPRACPKLCSFAFVRFSRTRRVGRRDSNCVVESFRHHCNASAALRQSAILHDIAELCVFASYKTPCSLLLPTLSTFDQNFLYSLNADLSILIFYLPTFHTPNQTSITLCSLIYLSIPDVRLLPTLC